MKHYRAIILVIANTSPLYSKFMEYWRSYMHSFENVKSFFLINDPSLCEVEIQNDDCIVCPFEENLVPGIFEKTIGGIKYVKHNFTFDFLIRTNLSSLYHIPRLLSFLDRLHPFQFAGADINYEHAVPFLSGAGMILSKDVCDILIKYENITSLSYNDIPDDVLISKILHLNNVYLSKIPRMNFIYNHFDENGSIPDHQFHFRIKNVQDRENLDNRIFKFLLKKFYHKESF